MANLMIQESASDSDEIKMLGSPLSAGSGGSGAAMRIAPPQLALPQHESTVGASAKVSEMSAAVRDSDIP